MKKRYVYTLCLMLSAALSLSSCLKDDNSETTLYDDMAITSFSLTTVNRYVHTTNSQGADSIYKVTITGTKLPTFTIDQYKQQIYNTKPLPYDCDLNHIIASIGSKNAGVIVLKSLKSDSLFQYNSTDSLDFSVERELRVYAYDGSGYRTYQVNVAKSTEDSGTVLWSEMTDGNIPAALSQVFTLARNGQNAFTFSKDGGITTTNELLGEDEDADFLPISDIAWTSFPFTTSENATYEILAGTNSADATAATIWRKIVESEHPEAARWVNIPLENSNNNYLPKMEHLNLVWFNNGLYAIGNDGKIYKSRDQGISWKVTTDITFPEGLDSSNVKAATDEAGYIWLMNPASGRIWKGSISE